jgi:SAM-dependent methyltransferase
MPLYDEQFYAWQADGSLSSAQVVVPILKELINPETVIDVGCGVGTWLRAWAHLDEGVTMLAGVDGEWVRELLPDPVRPLFRAHDLTEPLRLGRKADLVLCLEVAEHLPQRASRTLVESLCRHGSVVAFSAAPPGQDGTGHINLHWPSYWARLFAEHGFQPYDVVRQRIWWDQRVEWWYRQNIILFAKPSTARRLRIAKLEIRHPLDVVQPALLMPKLQPRLRATVCIPWRPSRSRLAAFKRVQEYWAMFGWPVITADSDTKVFSLAQARNNAVRQAETDVVVISDADTLVDPLNVLRAVAEPVGVCWPFTKYRILDPKYLDTPLSELASVPFINTWDGDGVAGVGGCLVATRKEYWRLGGQPPEFIGWGWEDTSFTSIVGTLSRVKRLEGSVYSFEHNQKPKHSTGSVHDTYVGAKADSRGWTRDVERNRELFQIYRVAQGRPWLMRAVLARRAADNPDDPLNWG